MPVPSHLALTPLVRQDAGVSRAPDVLAHSPGRAEWLGNHTDYNDGLVLGIGLEVGATVVARAIAGRQLVLRAEDLGEEVACGLDALRPVESGSWANYAIGVAAGFLARGAAGTGVELSIRSTVPMGAGLSGSAALECATARALQQAWGTNFDDMELARIGQEAEHKFAGVRCGLLDQVTSLFAARDHAVFFDCRSLEVERVLVPPEACFVIAQSGVKHALSDGSYNDRRAECEEAARTSESASSARPPRRCSTKRSTAVDCMVRPGDGPGTWSAKCPCGGCGGVAPGR